MFRKCPIKHFPGEVVYLSSVPARALLFPLVLQFAKSLETSHFIWMVLYRLSTDVEIINKLSVETLF